MRRVALLRGVNLGGRKLLMTDLAACCEGLGWTGVRTLLASGNVVFDSDLPSPAAEAVLETALAGHGLATDVLVRDGAELAAVTTANPFDEAAADHPSHLLVTFHRELFPAEALVRLAAVHNGPERLHAVGRELFTDFGGREQMRESMLVGAMRKARFPAIATGRNWNTVTKLRDLL